MGQAEVADDITAADEPPTLGPTARNVAFAVILGGTAPLGARLHDRLDRAADDRG
jgi:hypothetical protein